VRPGQPVRIERRNRGRRGHRPLPGGGPERHRRGGDDELPRGGGGRPVGPAEATSTGTPPPCRAGS
jgi:hypothetical protein